MGALIRRPPTTEQDRIVLSYDHAQLTADLTAKLLKVPSFVAAFRVEQVEYINPAGLAADPDNYFSISLKNGATVVAGPLASETDPIAANDFVDLELGETDGNRVLEPGEILSVVFDEIGVATLPPGRVVIRGVYV
jgi:hypothetical protein